MIGTIYVAAFAAIIMTPFFLMLHKLGWFRADALEELVGLDCNFTGAVDENVGETLAEGMREVRLSSKQQSHLQALPEQDRDDSAEEDNDKQEA